MSDARRQYSVRSKRALVIGGTGGIGREISRILAESGADLVIHGKDENKAEKLAASLGARPFPFRIEADGVPSFLDAISPLLPLDILVVAFGPFLERRIHETSAGEWTAMSAFCLALPGALVSACLPAMASSGYGRILLFGGNRTESIRSVPGMTAYAAAKTALGVIAKSVARGYAGSGVSCTVVCPGLVDTEYLDEERRIAWAALMPSGRLQDPAELAEKALALALDEDMAFNGSIVAADSGFLA
jgi:NAD(P)-dependent dehydrogenase (short-subunit alcohol dehydrogenase family)